MPEQSWSLRYLRKKTVAMKDKDTFKNNFHITSSDNAVMWGLYNWYYIISILLFGSEV